MVIVMATNKIYTISNARISRDVVLNNVLDNVLGSVLLIVSNRIEAKRIAAAAGGVRALDAVKFGRQQNRKLIGIFFSFVPKFVVGKQRIQDDPVSFRPVAVLDFVVVVVMFDGCCGSL